MTITLLKAERNERYKIINIELVIRGEVVIFFVLPTFEINWNWRGKWDYYSRFSFDEKQQIEKFIKDCLFNKIVEGL